MQTLEMDDSLMTYGLMQHIQGGSSVTGDDKEVISVQ